MANGWDTPSAGAASDQKPSSDLERILDLLVRATGSDTGVIGVMAEGEVRPVASLGLSPEALREEMPLCSLVAKSDRPALIGDTRDPEALTRKWALDPPLRARSILCSPVPPEGVGTAAAIVLAHATPGHFRASDVDTLSNAVRLVEHELTRTSRQAGFVDVQWGPGAAALVQSPVTRLFMKKWTGPVLREVERTPGIRFNDLMSRLPGISSRTLSDRLKEMQTAGLLTREQSATIPVRVCYQLTEPGRAAARDAARLAEGNDAMA